MRKIIAILAACAALASCERYFDISEQVDGGTVWMTFIPSNDYDTTFFCLQATTPLAGKADPVLTRDESVAVSVNGKPLEMKRHDLSIPDRITLYKTGYKFSPGDRVEATASVPGSGSVSANCVMPEVFSSFEWTTRTLPRKGIYQKIVIDISYDGNGEGGWYGASVVQCCEKTGQWEETDPETGEKYWSEMEYSTQTRYLSPVPMIDSDEFSASGEDPVTASPRYYNTLSGNHPAVQIWSDPPQKSGVSEKRVFAFASQFFEYKDEYSEKYDGVRAHRNFYKYKYRLALYRFSESYYNYLKARYNSEHDEFSGLGLAPPSCVYTNVQGGAGVCGAYTVIYSDWVELQ